MCPNYKSLAIVDGPIILKNQGGRVFLSAVVDVKENIKGTVKVRTISICSF